MSSIAIEGVQLLTAADVASFLGIHRRTVFRLINSGELPPPDVKVGRKLRRWRSDTIQEWLERRR